MKIDEVKLKFKRCVSTGFLFVPQKSNGKAILFVHGWGASKHQFYKRAIKFCEAGYTCMTFTMCGFGETKKDLTVMSPADHTDNLIRAFNKLEKEVKDITVCGFSYGGYITALTASHRKIKSIILNAPVLYEDKMIEKRLWKDGKSFSWVYNHKTGGDLTKLKPMKNISSFKGDLLFLGASNDKIASEKVLEEYFEIAENAKSREMIFIEGANHLLTSKKWQDEYVDIILKWLKEKDQK